MFHLQPLMFLGLFPLFAIFEGTLGRPLRGLDRHLSQVARIQHDKSYIERGYKTQQR